LRRIRIKKYHDKANRGTFTTVLKKPWLVFNLYPVSYLAKFFGGLLALKSLQRLVDIVYICMCQARLSIYYLLPTIAKGNKRSLGYTGISAGLLKNIENLIDYL
jgi:hypothetical protein